MASSSGPLRDSNRRFIHPFMSETTRERLVEAARLVVARDGWSAATSRAIVREAGANLALINYYFGSKAALLREALATAIAALEGGGPVPGDGAGDAPPLVAWMRGAEAVGADVNARVVLAACVEATRDAELAPVVREALAGLRAGVGAMLGEAGADPGLVTLLAAAMDGLLLHRAIDPETDVAGAAAALGRLLGGPG